MGVTKQQRATWPMRDKIYSPGRPPVWRRGQVQRFWVNIAEGLSSEDAALSVGVSSPVGSRWFREAGGMRPISVAPLSGRYLSFAEREEIAIAKAEGCGVREIARQVGRSPSTINSELRHNGRRSPGYSGYQATNAQWHADRRARRPKTGQALVVNEGLRDYVQDRLSGLIARPDGTSVEGPTVRFIGRRHGRRMDRRWGKGLEPGTDLQPAAGRLPQ